MTRRTALALSCKTLGAPSHGGNTGSNPVCATTHLQGFLPHGPPPDPRSATFLQPKCVVVDGRVQLSLGPNGTSPSGPTANESVEWSASRGSRGIGSRTHLGLRGVRRQAGPGVARPLRS